MKTKKQNTQIHFSLFLSLVVLTSLVLSGCSVVGGVSATPTSTAVPPTNTAVPPTNTAVPPTATATSAPTNTPTPVPSPTVDRTAVAAATATAVAEAVNAIVAPDLKEYGVDPSAGHVVFAEADSGKMELSSYMESRDIVLKKVGKQSDFVIQTEATWKTSGALSLCGITFRAADDMENGIQDRVFMMRLQFEPGWTIWRWQFGQFQSFISNKWQSSGHILDKNGTTNVIALVVKGKDVDIFINREKEQRVEETKLKEGQLALSAFQESGSTMCQFKNTWVWAFDK